MKLNNEQIIQNIINKISNICTNQNIINHIKNLLDINKEYIVEINNRHVFARRYEEVLEINISDNYFTVYSTSWGTTTRRKITFFTLDNNVIILFDDNQITSEGIIKKNYKYEFINNKLVHTSYSKKVHLEFECNNNIKKIQKKEIKDIYPIDEYSAIERITINDKTNYFIAAINNITLENIPIYGFIHSVVDKPITNEDFDEKVKKLK